MIKVLFSVGFGIILQFLPVAFINQAQASHCSDPSQHKTLSENHHCHGRGQGTEALDCHDHSGGLQPHKHGSSTNQRESESSQQAEK